MAVPTLAAGVPMSYRMELAARFLKSTTRICNLIAGPNDSRWIDQSPGASNGGRGIHRTFNIPCIGRFAAAVSGRISWSAKINPANTGSVTSADGVPNTVWTNGETCNWAMMSSWQDRTWSANVAGDGWGRSCLWGISLADLANYAQGNPFSNKTVTARLIYRASANALSGLNFQAGHGVVDSAAAPSITTTSAIDMTNNPGTIQTFEANCGSADDSGGTNPPMAQLSAGGNETGKTLQAAGVLFYIPSATYGYNLANLGTAQYTTADDLAVLGGGGAPTVTTAYARATLNALCIGMNAGASLVSLREQANVTVAEGADFDAGGYSVYQANLEAVLDALDAHSVALFGRPVDCHWLRAPFQRYDHSVNYSALKAAAHHAICKKRPNCCHDAFGAFQTQSNAGTPEYGNQVNTTDGIHPNGADGTGAAGSSKGNGDVVWMGAAWAALEQAYAAQLGMERVSRVLRSRVCA